MAKRSDFPTGVVLPLLIWILMTSVSLRLNAVSIHATASRWDMATSFVLADDGRLWCWGSNEIGQYGDGTTVSRLTGRPAPLPEGVTGWQEFAAGLRYFAVAKDGRLHAWGEPEMPPGVNPSSSPNNRAPIPVRLGSRVWKKAVPPVVTRDPGDVPPFGLGIDAGGGLWWLRAPWPGPDAAGAFSGYREDPAGLPADAGPVVDVVGGGRCFLALTASGRVFASGQSSLGLRGPRSALVGDFFDIGFLEVDPPVGVSHWTRIAVVSNQAFAWSDSGGLYVWGNLNGADWAGLQPKREPLFVPGVPSGLPIRQIVGQGSSLVSYLFVDDAGDVFGCGPGEPVWPYFGNYGLDLFAQKTRMRLEPELTPVLELSSTESFRLVLGPDGVVRAHGQNHSGQLGGTPPTTPGNPAAWVIPAGDAPFLSGDAADLPILNLVADPRLMIEPSNAARTNGQYGRLTVVRSGRTDLETSPLIQISTRLTTGEPNPDTNAVKVVWNAQFLSLVKLTPGQTTYEIPLPPAYYEAGDDSLRIDFTLMPSPWYDLGSNPVATVTYQATPAENPAPQVRVLWPPRGARVYTSGQLEYVLEMRDPDGYVAELTLDHGGWWIPLPNVHERFEPMPAGSTRRYRAGLTPGFGTGLLEFGADITVIDNRGNRTFIPNAVSPPTEYVRNPGRSLELLVDGRPQRLLLPSTTGPVVLEESTDLQTWELLESYSMPSGMPSSPKVLSAAGTTPRFFRVRNPEMPVVPTY